MRRTRTFVWNGDAAQAVDRTIFTVPPTQRWKILEIDRRLTVGGGSKAVSVFTSTGALGNNETVTIGSTVYTYKTALTPAAYEVLIGANQTASHLNLLRAITAGAGSGTLYGAGTVAHPSVTATASDGTTTTIEALVAGTAANSIATTETCANASWPGATMNSGTPGTACEFQVRCVPSGTATASGRAALLAAADCTITATINTNLTAAAKTLTSTLANRILQAGESLGLDFTGTMTGLVGLSVSVTAIQIGPDILG